MKYQVQKYVKADMNNREVIAEHTGVMNETEQAAWYGLHTAAPLADTEAYALVPDNHQWFKTSDPDPSVTTLVADVLVDKPEAGPAEGKPVAYEDMIQKILEDNKKARQAQVERDEQMRQTLAQLSSK
jgi:hypothetical protein